MKPKSIAVCMIIAIAVASVTKAQTFKIDSNYLSRKAFNALTNRLFGQIATGQSTASLANFGAFDPVNGSATFNAFTPLNFNGDTAKYVPLLSLEAKGDLGSDNILTLFSNTKLNTNIDATIKLHFPIPHWFKIGFYGSHYIDLYSRKQKLQQEYELKEQLADSAFKNKVRDTQYVQWQMNAITQKIKKKRDSLQIYRDSIDREAGKTNPDTSIMLRLTKAFSDTRDEISNYFKDSMGLKLKKDSIKLHYDTDPDVMENEWHIVQKQLRDAFNDSLLKMEVGAPITRVRLFWISAIGNFNQKKYWFYNEQLPFEQRISKDTYAKFNVGAEVNYYFQRLRSNHAHYITIGLKRKQDNNIEDLSTSSIVQKIKSSNGTTEREIDNTYSAYTDTVRRYRSWFWYGNYYFMFKYNSLSAIHFFPEIDSRKYQNGDEKTLKNLGIGYVMSVKDSKKDKSILNFEAYFKFLDLDDQDKTKKKFYNRNEIGFRIGFPLNFLIN